MNILKTVILIFCFFLSVTFYAQSEDTLQDVKISNFKFYHSIGTIDQSFSLKKLNFEKNVPPLVLYNKTTNMYDTYLNINDNYNYTHSRVTFRKRSNFFTTLFLGNDSFMESNTLIPNSSILWSEDGKYRVRDSFNPHGASTMGEALIGGVLGLLFD